MPISREPLLHPVEILALRPTQMTVGMHEVREKRLHWRQHKGKKKAEFLGQHMLPVISGPSGRYYIIDHHHLALALHEEGQQRVLVTVVADLHNLDREAFWTVLDTHGWVHPYDAGGRRRDYAALPKTVEKLRDDPFRSLAGELRRVGGFAKDTTPFSEFLWADFLRRRMKRARVERNFSSALKRARKFAKSLDANYLPGWCGPVTEG